MYSTYVGVSKSVLQRWSSKWGTSVPCIFRVYCIGGSENFLSKRSFFYKEVSSLGSSSRRAVKIKVLRSDLFHTVSVVTFHICTMVNSLHLCLSNLYIYRGTEHSKGFQRPIGGQHLMYPLLGNMVSFILIHNTYVLLCNTVHNALWLHCVTRCSQPTNVDFLVW